ncbi:MAG: ATP-binding cassette domain-containing protein [Planctomycetaceae bacterium]|nr:ATP-binding cassette domain-containing protein [Planctomycetaceae bacterium]
MITLSDIRKSYDGGKTFAVDGISLEIADGEFLAIVGESGCGKTTLMKSINRLNPMTSGTIEIDGDDISALDPVLLRRRIGYVFQRIGLFPHLTVGENVATVPRLLKWDEGDVSRRVDELLNLVNLVPEDYRDRRSKDLSGGQQQRVGLARALAGRPSIMLMDEPFGALDPMTRDQLQEDYQQLHRELSLTTIMVTHDMVEALLMADRIAVMSAGQVMQVGTPQELMTNPRNDTVESFVATPKRQADRLEALANQGGSA